MKTIRQRIETAFAKWEHMNEDEHMPTSMKVWIQRTNNYFLKVEKLMVELPPEEAQFQTQCAERVRLQKLILTTINKTS